MSEPKFTPGPWLLESESRDGNGSDLIITTADGTWNIADCRDNLNGLADRAAHPEANARLIAAAPELAELLAQAIDLMPPSAPVFQSWLRQARAALAKAIGHD